MLNKRLFAWMLIITIVLINVVVVRAATELVRATYRGYIEVDGNQVVLHRDGDSWRYTAVDVPEDVAADGVYLYLLYSDGHLIRVSTSDGATELLQGKWIKLVTTSEYVLGFKQLGGTVYERIGVVILTPGYGNVDEIVGSVEFGDIQYLGEMSGKVLLKVAPEWVIVPLGDSQSTATSPYYYTVDEYSVNKIEVDSDIAHVWHDVCVYGSWMGTWDINKDGHWVCEKKEPLFRFAWAGYGYLLDTLGNVIDWDNGKVVVTNVSDVVDANGGGVLLKDFGGHLRIISDEYVPPIVGKHGEQSLETKHLQWRAVSPRLIEIGISDETGLTATGYLEVSRIETATSREDSEELLEAYGAIPVGFGMRWGVYMIVSETGSVRYVNVSDIEWDSGGIIIRGIEQSGTLTVPANSVPSNRLERYQDISVEKIFWPEKGNSMTNVGMLVYATLSTATHGFEDTLDVFYIELPVSVAGSNTATVRIPIGIGMPWASTSGHSWLDPQLEYVLRLGYALQTSAHNMWLFIENMCDELEVGSLEVYGYPVSCGIPPEFDLKKVIIDFWNDDLHGSWNKPFQGYEAQSPTGMMWVRFVGGEGGGVSFPYSEITTDGRLFVATITDVGLALIGVLTNRLPMGLNIAFSIASGMVKLLSILVEDLAKHVSWKDYKMVVIGNNSYGETDLALNTLANYYAAYRKNGSFAGYHEFILTPFSQSTATDRWRHWMLKIYPDSSMVQKAKLSIDANDELDPFIKAFVKEILDMYLENGAMPGVLSYAKVIPSGIRFGPALQYLANMRIGFMGVLNLYGSESNGYVTKMPLFIGMPINSPPQINKFVDLLNDPGMYAKSPTTRDIGGIYTTRDDTLWLLRANFNGAAEYKQILREMTILDNGESLRRLLVMPALGEDSVYFMASGNCFPPLCWFGSHLNRMVVSRPSEIVLAIEGENDADAIGAWNLDEHIFSVSVGDLIEEFLDVYCPNAGDTTDDCMLWVLRGFILAFYDEDSEFPFGIYRFPVIVFSSENGSFPVPVSLHYINVLQAGSQLSLFNDMPESVWGISHDEAVLGKGMELSPESMSWRCLVYNSGNQGYVLDMLHYQTYELDGIVAGVSGSRFWLWDGGNHTLTEYQITDSNCGYEVIPSHAWFDDYDWGSVKAVAVNDTFNIVGILKPGKLELRKLSSGQLVKVFDIPDVDASYLLLKIKNAPDHVEGLALVVYGEEPSQGDDAMPYAGGLRDVYMIQFWGAGLNSLTETGTGYLKGVYVYPDMTKDDVVIVYRNRLWKWPKWVLGKIYQPETIFGK